MSAPTSNQAANLINQQANRSKIVPISAAILLVLALSAVFAYRAIATRAAPPASQVVTIRQLEEEYGLKVNLVALTAGGGMLDVRLKVTDAQKANQLFSQQTEYPAIMVGKKGPLLKVPQEGQQDLKRLENGSMIFLLPINSHAAIKPNTSVTIVIGSLHLEPIKVQS